VSVTDWNSDSKIGAIYEGIVFKGRVTDDQVPAISRWTQYSVICKGSMVLLVNPHVIYKFLYPHSLIHYDPKPPSPPPKYFKYHYDLPASAEVQDYPNTPQSGHHDTHSPYSIQIHHYFSPHQRFSSFYSVPQHTPSSIVLRSEELVVPPEDDDFCA